MLDLLLSIVVCSIATAFTFGWARAWMHFCIYNFDSCQVKQSVRSLAVPLAVSCLIGAASLFFGFITCVLISRVIVL